MRTMYKDLTKNTGAYRKVELRAKSRNAEVVKVRETDDSEVLICWLKTEQEQMVTLYSLETNRFFRDLYFPNFLTPRQENIEEAYQRV